MKKKLPLFCLALLALLAFSCQKEPSSTKDKEDSEDEIIGDMLSDKQLDILKDMNMPIYEGDNPPNITGYYHTDDLDCIEDTDGYASYYQDLDYYWNFHDKDGQNIDLDYFNNGSDEATGKGAYIFGEGNNFTVYMETEGKINGTNITYTQVSVYSGTKTSSGIANFTMGFILTSKQNDTSKKMMDVNDARVFVDDLAEKLTSNPGFYSIRYDAAIDKPMFLAASSK